MGLLGNNENEENVVRSEQVRQERTYRTDSDLPVDDHAEMKASIYQLMGKVDRLESGVATYGKQITESDFRSPVTRAKEAAKSAKAAATAASFAAFLALLTLAVLVYHVWFQ